MKTYQVAAYCEDNTHGVKKHDYYREYKIRANNESEAEDKAGNKYKKEMGFTADTIEVIRK